MPVPFLSIVTSDCIENGKDYNAGGARYNTSVICRVLVPVQSATAWLLLSTTYLSKKKFTMDELLEAMEANFVGYEQYSQPG